MCLAFPTRVFCGSPVYIYAILLLFLVFANIETPLWGDDYCYIMPVSISKAVALAWRDYFDWTGRFFASAILYIAMAIGRRWSMIPFDLLNAVIFIVLVRNVLALAQPAGEAPRSPLARANDLVFVALMLWWLPRTIGEVALWKTGAIGYLWAVTGELFVVRLVLAGGAGNRWWHIPFGFFIATFLEPLSLVISGLLLARCFWLRRQRRPPPLGLAGGHLAGTVFLLVAPGNFVRAATLAASPPLDRIVGVVGNLGSLFDPTWIVAVAVVALAGAGLARTALAGRGWMFVALALIYMAVLLGVPRPALAARVSFPASVFLICALATVFLRRPVTARRDRLTALVLLILLGIHTAIVVPDLIGLARIDRAWAADPQLRMGPETDVVLPGVLVHGRLVYARKHLFFEGLTPEANYVANYCYARVMNVRSVVAR
jgi:hypothetical protein